MNAQLGSGLPSLLAAVGMRRGGVVNSERQGVGFLISAFSDRSFVRSR